MMVEMGKIGKFRKNLEKLTSGNQNPTFKSGKNRIFSGNLREKSGKNDLKILYQPCDSYLGRPEMIVRVYRLGKMIVREHVT